MPRLLRLHSKAATSRRTASALQDYMLRQKLTARHYGSAMRRLGLYLGRLPGFDKTGFDRSELIECVRAAEACGYDSFWMPEVWEHDAIAILAELAVNTERIGLGTGIINVFSRSPALIAMSAASIDEV